MISNETLCNPIALREPDGADCQVNHNKTICAVESVYRGSVNCCRFTAKLGDPFGAMSACVCMNVGRL